MLILDNECSEDLKTAFRKIKLDNDLSDEKKILVHRLNFLHGASILGIVAQLLALYYEI